jgi:hypothetical protein
MNLSDINDHAGDTDRIVLPTPFRPGQGNPRRERAVKVGEVPRLNAAVRRSPTISRVLNIVDIKRMMAAIAA